MVVITFITEYFPKNNAGHSVSYVELFINLSAIQDAFTISTYLFSNDSSLNIVNSTVDYGNLLANQSSLGSGFSISVPYNYKGGTVEFMLSR